MMARIGTLHMGWTTALVLFSTLLTPSRDNRAVAAELYNFNGTNVNIADNDGIASNFIDLSGAPAGAQVTSVKFHAVIRHTFRGDLRAWVTTEQPPGHWNDYIFHDRSGGSADDLDVTMDNVHTWDGFSPNRRWYLSAQDFALGDTGYIDFFEIWVRYSVCSTPGSFSLTSPAANTTGVSRTPMFQWQSASGATSYRIQVTGDLFGLPNPLPFRDLPLGNVTSWPYNGELNCNTPFWWRVFAVNSCGQTVNSGDWRKFTTISGIPSSFSLTSPGAGATGVSLTPTFQWQASSGAMSYRVELWSSVGGVCTPVPYSYTSSNITSTSWTYNGPALGCGLPYCWHVKAIGPCGSETENTGGWRSFTTIARPVFAATSPTNNSQNVSRSPTFSWQPAGGATGYRVEVWSNVGGLCTPAPFSYAKEVGNTTTWDYDGPTVGCGLPYCWHVLAHGPCGDTVNTSDWRTFTTISGIPGSFSLTSPSPGAIDVPLIPTFQWQASSGTVSYRIQITGDLFGFPNPVLLRDTNVGSATSWTGGQLNCGMAYWWRVLALGPCGAETENTGSWRKFTTAIPPSFGVVFPPHGATGVPRTPTFQWQSAPGATNYCIQVTGDLFGVPNPLPFRDLCVGNTTSLPYNGELNCNTAYWWRVFAVNACGQTVNIGDWRKFTTISGIPSTFSLTSPSNGATSVPLTPIFQWQDSSGATSYRVEVFEMVGGVCQDPFFDESVSAPTYLYNGPSLVPGLSYCWDVAAIGPCGAETGDSDTLSYFTVIPPASCSPVCGAKLNVACLEGTQRTNSDAVGLMVYGTDTPWCTAWVFAAPDVMITNAHCVKPGGKWGCEQISPGQLQVRFFNECDRCQGGNVRADQFDVGVSRVLWIDDEHDFALLEMEENVAESYGALSVSCEDLALDDDCYLIHHASGGSTVVSQVMKGIDWGTVLDTFDNPGSECPPDRTTTVSGLHYALWSKGGASGSPVFSTVTDDVQAINNRGDDRTHCYDSGYGIPMSLIAPIALTHLDGRTIRVAAGTGHGCIDQVVARFSTCRGRPSVDTPSECAMADLNGDDLVDLLDFAVLQNVFDY